MFRESEHLFCVTDHEHQASKIMLQCIWFYIVLLCSLWGTEPLVTFPGVLCLLWIFLPWAKCCLFSIKSACSLCYPARSRLEHSLVRPHQILASSPPPWACKGTGVFKERPPMYVSPGGERWCRSRGGSSSSVLNVAPGLFTSTGTSPFVTGRPLQSDLYIAKVIGLIISSFFIMRHRLSNWWVGGKATQGNECW